ncbi:MAG: nuclear transport factor 2 family protein [Candidatus Competibacteraceae bacterium]|nr:nuclear transport factor 2 family protein [Candidatus Competibacteraceae bacterium]
MKNNEQSVNEVRAAMDAWNAALKEKDLGTMFKDYADRYRLFDVGSTANSIEETKTLWEQCFPYFDKPEIEYKNMVIEATDDMAVVHFNSRLNGISVEMPCEMAKAWLRGTVCFRKIDGVWKCIHEHCSFPVNCETNQINFEAAA